jgi:hypothetical protein
VDGENSDTSIESFLCHACIQRELASDCGFKRKRDADVVQEKCNRELDSKKCSGELGLRVPKPALAAHEHHWPPLFPNPSPNLEGSI